MELLPSLAMQAVLPSLAIQGSEAEDEDEEVAVSNLPSSR